MITEKQAEFILTVLSICSDVHLRRLSDDKEAVRAANGISRRYQSLKGVMILKLPQKWRGKNSYCRLNEKGINTPF